jgi:fatty acid desaturase
MDLEALPTFSARAARPARGGTTTRSSALAAQESSVVEWPTMAVALAIHGGFIVLTLCFNSLPLLLSACLGALLLAWYGSLQHETIHGHPTSSKRFNALLGALPLSLWIPYAIYRQTHLRHHRYRGHRLTQVEHDPESYYLPTAVIAQAGPLKRGLFAANCTLAGRLILGPAITLATFWAGELKLILNGDRRRARIWLMHAVAVAVVATWLAVVCHISLLAYLAFVVYPSVAVTQLRSFAEHRAHADPRQRTRAVEAHPFWALIFLNNNLHIAHHAHPRLPWYKLPAAWQEVRPAAQAHGLTFHGGYWEVARRYLFRRFIHLERDGI